MAEELRRNQCSRVWATAVYRNEKRHCLGKALGSWQKTQLGRRGNKKGIGGSRSQNLPTLQDCLVLKKNKQDKNKGEWGWGAMGTLIYCWWDVRWYSCFGKECAFLQKVKHRNNEWPKNSPLCQTQGKWKCYVRTKNCTWLFIEALLIIVKKNGNNPDVNHLMNG